MRMQYALSAAAIVTAMAMPTAVRAAQQPPVHNMGGMGQPASQAAVAECAQAQPRASQALDAANVRLEAARQSNSPAAMRAAVDDLQGALRQLRVLLGACAGLQAAAADMPAGHVMPGGQQMPNTAQASPVSTGTAIMNPGSTALAPVTPGAADPHAGHVMPGAPQATSATQAQTGQASSTGNVTTTLRTIPSPALGAAENRFEVTVNDRQGKPVDGADVSLLLYMPAMPSMKMPEMRNEVKLTGTGSGKYEGAVQVMMAGSWTVTVSVKQNGKEVGQQNVRVTAK